MAFGIPISPMNNAAIVQSANNASLAEHERRASYACQNNGSRNINFKKSLNFALQK